MLSRAGCLLTLLALSSLSGAVRADSDVVDAGDFWDSDDQVEPVKPIQVPKQIPTKTSQQPDQQIPLTDPTPTPEPSKTPKTPTQRGSRSIWGSIAGRQGSYFVEAGFALIAAWFVAGIFTGKEANSKIVKAWAVTHCSEGGVLERNFAQLGAADGKSNELVVRENSKKFMFWASGRRHCQVCLSYTTIIKAIARTLQISQKHNSN